MQQPALFDLMSARTRYLARRQAVLTQNVANADTPDYRPLDLRPAGSRELLALKRAAGGPRGVDVARTQPAHLAGSPPSRPDDDPRARATDGFETAPSGNAVVLDEQLEKLGETQLGYELATNLYRRHVGLLKTALGSGNG